MSGTRSNWRASLRPATWRNISFKVLSSEALSGRRVHLHEYPFRDEPWAEDLGRRSRTLAIKGFLVGDNAADQLQRFQQAAEERGSGELIHPVRGNKTVTLLTCADSDAWEEGRVIRLALEFVETGERRFPDSLTDGKAEVDGGAKALDDAAGTAGETGLLATLKEGYAGAQRIVRTAQSYVSTATRLVGSATGAIRSVTGLASIPGIGSLGRFSGGGFGLTTVTRSLGTVTSLSGGVSSALSRFHTARTSVTRLGEGVMTLAGKL